MRKTALLLAALFVAASAGTAAAIPPPVKTGSGGCEEGFTSVANVGSIHLCVVTLAPEAFVSSTHCPSGYLEAGSGVAGQWVCVNI